MTPAPAPAQRLVVVVRTGDPARVVEALRAAVGLTLRGDRVTVVLGDAAVALADDPAAARALGTLGVLGHEVARGDGAIAAAIGAADAVEVWT